MTVDELKAWIESHFDTVVFPESAYEFVTVANDKLGRLPFAAMYKDADSAKTDLIWLRMIKKSCVLAWRVLPKVETEKNFDTGELVSEVFLRFTLIGLMDEQP